jgi:hypothetical protein
MKSTQNKHLDMVPLPENNNKINIFNRSYSKRPKLITHVTQNKGKRINL